MPDDSEAQPLLPEGIERSDDASASVPTHEYEPPPDFMGQHQTQQPELENTGNQPQPQQRPQSLAERVSAQMLNRKTDRQR